MHRHPSQMCRAFTLVELAMVLVVIGLLVGAVVGGSSLLRQSELQTIIADYSKYSTAVAQFTKQYGGLPGDLLDATNYWGDDNTNCPDAAVTDGTPGTCNGNGNGIFNAIVAANTTGEFFQFWKHLALAGFIDGNYTGLSGAAATGRDVSIGSNVPKSRITGAGFSIYYQIVAAGHADRWDAADGNFLDFGARNAGGYETDQPVLKPQEAWNIDKKIDDGIPSQGKVFSYKSGLNPNCATTTVDATAQYNLTNSSTACAFQFLLK